MGISASLLSLFASLRFVFLLSLSLFHPIFAFFLFYSLHCRKGLWGSVDHARFYTAAASYALEHMHERRIVYRDRASVLEKHVR